MSLTAPLMIVAALIFPQLGDHFHAIVGTDEVGEIHVELFSAPDTEIDECTVLYSSFPRDIGERVCNLVRQQSVQIPALDQQGQPVYGTAIYSFRTNAGSRWQAASILRRDPVLEIGVSQLPAGIESELFVGLRVLIDAQGRVELCEENTREADAYTAIACSQLSGVPHPVRTDRAGQPVRYLTDMNVVFVVG